MSANSLVYRDLSSTMFVLQYTGMFVLQYTGMFVLQYT